MRIVTRILKDLFNKYIFFVNNINIENLKTNYNNKKVILDIRLFVLIYIFQLNAILINIKLLEYTIFEKKSQFCKFEIKIVDFVYNFNNRLSNNIKIIKIIK